MSDEDGIRRTIANYCQLFDAKQWDELGKIFTEDASVTSRRGTFTGRVDVIRDLKSAMTEDYHGTLFMSNTVITVDDGTARAVSDFLEVEDNKILAVGTYTDTLAKTPADSWLLASKEIRLKLPQAGTGAVRVNSGAARTPAAGHRGSPPVASGLAAGAPAEPAAIRRSCQEGGVGGADRDCDPAVKETRQ